MSRTRDLAWAVGVPVAGDGPFAGYTLGDLVAETWNEPSCAAPLGRFLDALAALGDLVPTDERAAARLIRDALPGLTDDLFDSARAARSLAGE